MGLRATIYLTDHSAHNFLVERNVDGFFPFIYFDESSPRWVDEMPLDLDRTWHAIHFLTTGDSSATLLLNGLQVPEIADHFESHSSKAILDVFHKIGGKSAAEILNGTSMETLNSLGIYDTTWDESARPYLLGKLCGFIEKITIASETNKGLFVTIS